MVKNKKEATPTTEFRHLEDKFKLIVEGAKDFAIFLVSPQGIIESWNDGAKNLYGFSEDEVLRKEYSLLYTEEAKVEDLPAFDLGKAKKGGSFTYEAWRVRKDGSMFCAEISITSLIDERRNHLGFSNIVRDLTQRKTAEESLKKSEEKYRLLIEGVTDYAIFMLDPNGYIESWNEGAKKLKGYKEQEIIGKHFSIFYPEEKKKEKFPEYELEEAKKLGRFEDEGIRVRNDGSTFYANVIITALLDENKKLMGFSKITRDLTERKEAEELLRRSEEKYRLLVEGVRDYAIFMLDPEGIIVSWNEGAKRLKKYEANEIIGKHFSIFYPEEKRQAKYPEYELEEAERLGKFEDEGIRVRKDGTTFYANVVITALYNSERLIGFSKITRDLTERKQAEENLRKLNLELEGRVQDRTKELSKTVIELKRINADLDNFIYTASHDLKAPVSNIEGLMYNLVKKLKKNNFSNAEVDGLLEMINKSVSRFQNTINDLTQINESQKVNAGDVVQIDIKEIIEDVIASIDHLVKQSKAKINIDIKPIEGFAFSRVHLRSILYNFITNAIKYRSTERQLFIDVKSYQAGECFVIEVKDNGLGIREENKSKVFEMFKRFNTHVEGSGIGLYIVRKIVENAGGKVEIESEAGKGTTFKVYLPLGEV